MVRYAPVFIALLCIGCTVFGAPLVDSTVAFSAGLTNTQHINDKETVLYDKVFVNEQNGYDATTGTFNAPVTGVYIFHFHAYNTNKDSVMWLELHHNDQATISLSGYNSHTVGSNTVMLKLRKNDRVAVKSHEQQSFSLFGLPDQVYSTFTGYLVEEMSQIYMDSSSPVG